MIQLFRWRTRLDVKPIDSNSILVLLRFEGSIVVNSISTNLFNSRKFVVVEVKNYFVRTKKKFIFIFSSCHSSSPFLFEIDINSLNLIHQTTFHDPVSNSLVFLCKFDASFNAKRDNCSWNREMLEARWASSGILLNSILSWDRYIFSHIYSRKFFEILLFVIPRLPRIRTISNNKI